MKRAFTLIELMIVIAVLVVLMGMVFKLGSIGGDTWRRTTTISRLQRLENCLSGYHAAFGNYPPVRLHGSRDIYRVVGGHGIQTERRNENIWGWTKIGEQAENEAWNQVRAACRSQPVDCRFPFPEGYDKKIVAISDSLKQLANSQRGQERLKNDQELKRRIMAGFDDGVSRNQGRLNGSRDEDSWTEIQLFKFGLMSFLLPRYMVMMNGPREFFTGYKQWTGNNILPADPFTGLKTNWSQLWSDATSQRNEDLARLANIPSQAVCARWMPNLEGVCEANHKFVLFGVDIRDTTMAESLRSDNFDLGYDLYAPGDANSTSTANQYILDGVGVNDGWYHEFYYYSPAPHQRYTLWSAGPNGRTFPPWINRTKMTSKANECVSLWVNDDIIHLSN